MILRVQPEAARLPGRVPEVIFRDDLERLDIHHGNLLLVLHIHIQLALAVALGLLHRAAHVQRPRHGAILRINGRDAGGFVAEDIDPVRERFQQDAVRPARHRDALELLHRLRVKHADLGAAAEPMMRGGVDGHAVPADVRDGPDVLVAV